MSAKQMDQEWCRQLIIRVCSFSGYSDNGAPKQEEDTFMERDNPKNCLNGNNSNSSVSYSRECDLPVIPFISFLFFGTY